MIERIIRLLAQIPQDKISHFAGGTILGTAGLVFGIEGALFLPFVVGLAKEIWDHYHPPHEADPLDLLATVLGAAPVWITWGVK